ncbi:ACT domain-containing protein [Christensenellaceae bacterium OttesenSCG-928-L17]|nr:ACT domain-containing protein [Christensenellaceae bacterium OttesenSCG-928-L17]
MKLQVLTPDFSVCKLEHSAGVRVDIPFTCLFQTDDECSLVCKTEFVPQNTIAREDGWRMLRIQGTLDFSLIGILARLTDVLQNAGVSVFALSTYQTDYLLIKQAALPAALHALVSAGYEITEEAA